MKTVFIVEGWSDHDQVMGALAGYNAETIVTNGTKINNRLKTQIDSHLWAGDDIYILSDPDPAGEQLCNMLQQAYPMISRIEVDPDQCKYMKGRKTFNDRRYKYGIEYASYRYLRELLLPYVPE